VEYGIHWLSPEQEMRA